MAEPLCRPNPVSPRGGWAPPPPTRSRVGEAAGVAGSGGPAVRRGQGSAVTPPSKFRLLLEAPSETPPQGFFAKRQTSSTKSKRSTEVWKVGRPQCAGASSHVVGGRSPRGSGGNHNFDRKRLI